MDACICYRVCLFPSILYINEEQLYAVQSNIVIFMLRVLVQGVGSVLHISYFHFIVRCCKFVLSICDYWDRIDYHTD